MPKGSRVLGVIPRALISCEAYMESVRVDLNAYGGPSAFYPHSYSR